MHSEDAKNIIRITKYPPVGARSMTGGLPHYDLAPVPGPVVIPQVNARGSTCFLMIETQDALDAVEDIAALPGCDVLLVGANDLATEIGTLPDWDHPKFIGALERVGKAAKKHGKIFGMAGLYHRPDLMDRIVNEFGCRWVLGGLDLPLLLGAAKQNCSVLKSAQKSSKL